METFKIGDTIKIKEECIKIFLPIDHVRKDKVLTITDIYGDNEFYCRINGYSHWYFINYFEKVKRKLRLG